MFTRATEAHSQADGLPVYCVLPQLPQRDAHEGGGVLVGAGLAAQEHTTRVVMWCGILFFVWPQDKATKADPEKGPIVAWGLPFRPTHR